MAVRSLKIEDSLFEIKEQDKNNEARNFKVRNYLKLREFNFSSTKDSHFQFIFSLSIEEILEDLQTLLRLELGDGASVHVKWCNGFFRVVLELDFEAPALTTPKELELLIDQSAYFVCFEVYFDMQKSCLYPSINQVVALSEVPVETWNKIESVVQQIFRIDLPNSTENSFYGEQVLKQLFEYSDKTMPAPAHAVKKILERCVFLKFLTDEKGENVEFQITSHKTPMPMSGRPYHFLERTQKANDFSGKKIDLTQSSLLGLFSLFDDVSDLDSNTINEYFKVMPHDICSILIYKLLSSNSKYSDRIALKSAIDNLENSSTKVALQLQYARKYEDFSTAISCLIEFLELLDEPIKQKLYSPNDLLGSLYLKAGLSQQALEYLKESLGRTPNKRRIIKKIEFIETFLQGTRTQMREKEQVNPVDPSYQNMLNLYNTDKKSKEILQVFTDNLDLFANEPLKLSFLVKLLLENGLHEQASSLLEKVSIQGSCDAVSLQNYISELSLRWSRIDFKIDDRKEHDKSSEDLPEDSTIIVDPSSYKNVQSEIFSKPPEIAEISRTQANDDSNVEIDNNLEDSLFRIEPAVKSEEEGVHRFRIPSDDDNMPFEPQEFVPQEQVEFNTSLRPFAIPTIDSKIASRISPIDESLDQSNSLKAQIKSEFSDQAIENKNYTKALDFDWKFAIAQNTVEAGQTSIVKSADFSSGIEKHIAVQAFALMTGELNELKDWPLPVWRVPGVANYSYRYRSRLPSGEISNLLKSEPFNNILSLSPLFYRVWHDRFASGILKKLGGGRVNERSFQKIDPAQCNLLKRSNLLTHSEFQGLDQMSYFDARGLKNHIFYQYSKNAVYFDMSYYDLRPLSHFYHSFVSTLICLKLDYYIPLSLSPHKHIKSLLGALVQLSEANFAKKLLGFFNDDKQRYIKQMKHLTPDRVLEMVRQLNSLSSSQLEKIWTAMRQHVYLVDLSMHLDLIGLCEFLTDVDLANKSNLNVSEIYSYHEDIPKLIITTTKLRLNSDAK